MYYGELVEKVMNTYDFTYEQATTYLASAFFAIATDEQVDRIANNLPTLA